MVSVALDDAGRISSFVDKRLGRELLPTGAAAAELTIAPDHPVEFDAWDVERWTARLARPLDSCERITVGAPGPLVGAIAVERSIGASRMTTTYRLTAGSPRLDIGFDIDWAHDEHLLAVRFPLDVRADEARCGIQFGHVSRPTHRNTSWDIAKFEVCAHRWVDLSEPSFGVAVLDDTRFGHAVQDGGIRVTLLRAPNFPDPRADRGHHSCRLALFPHGPGPGLAEVVAEAERFTLPVRTIGARRPTADHGPIGPAPVAVSGRGVEVTAVKLADDGSGDLIVRLFEACGDRRSVAIACPAPITEAARTDLLEEPLALLDVDGGAVDLVLRPFEIATLRLRSTPGAARPGPGGASRSSLTPE